MRLFLAIELPIPLRESLSRFIDTVKGAPGMGDREAGRARWARADGMHLTLKFLGETDRTHAGSIVAHLSERTTGMFSGMTLRVGGVGKFPARGRPRVLWVGVAEESGPENPGRLARLHAIVEEGCAEGGFPREERPFHPHITLARLADGPPPEGLDRILSDYRSAEFGRFTAESLTLFQSILSPKGAEYRSMEAVDL